MDCIWYNGLYTCTPRVGSRQAPKINLFGLHYCVFHPFSPANQEVLHAHPTLLPNVRANGSLFSWEGPNEAAGIDRFQSLYTGFCMPMWMLIQYLGTGIVDRNWFSLEKSPSEMSV